MKTDYRYKAMKQNSIAIAVVLTATILTAVFATTSLAYADSSETESEAKVKEKAIASGESILDNCGYINSQVGSAETSCADFSGIGQEE
jgi:FlaG/FlaF family flagellin (archaellin)